MCYYLRIFRVLKHVLQYPSYSSITYQQFHLHTCLVKMCVLGVLYMSFMFLLRVHVLRIIKRYLSSCFCQRKLMTTRVLILQVFFTHFYSTMSSCIEFLVIWDERIWWKYVVLSTIDIKHLKTAEWVHGLHILLYLLKIFRNSSNELTKDYKQLGVSMRWRIFVTG